MKRSDISYVKTYTGVISALLQTYNVIHPKDIISDTTPDTAQQNVTVYLSLIGFYGGRGLTARILRRKRLNAQRYVWPRRINFSSGPANFLILHQCVCSQKNLRFADRKSKIRKAFDAYSFNALSVSLATHTRRGRFQLDLRISSPFIGAYVL